MKVTIVGSYPDPRLIKESNSLVNGGYEVDLILWDRGLSFSKENIKCNITRFNYGKKYFGNLETVFFIPFWWIFIFYWLLKMDQEIIHVANLDNYIIAILVAKIKKKKIVYEMFDFYGDTVVFPIFTKFFRKILKKLDSFLMNFSDVIIIADKSRLKQIGYVKKKVEIINNSPNDMFKDKLPKFKNKNFTVFYGGQVLDQRGLEQVILAIKDIPNANLVIMGYCYSQEYKNKLINLSHGLKNVKLTLEAVPPEIIIEQTAKSDLIIALYDPKIPNNKYASPNKLFEAMMCGKPIIVNNGTSMVGIINECNCGIVIPYGDVKSIKTAIIYLMENRNISIELGINGRKAYEYEYNWSIMERKLYEIYEYLVIY